MSAVARLAGYAAALALVFGVALAAGAVVGPSRDGSTRADAGHRAAGPAAMTDMEAHRSGGRVAVQPVRGLAVGDDAVGLELARTTARPGEPFRLGFRIVGRAVRGFDVEHTKRMHLIVVRRDMAGFEHLHPTQAADGAWSAPVTLHDAGSYRVFADFSVGGTPRTLAADLQADGRVASQPFPASADLAAVDGLRVRLTEGASHAGEASQLGFTVTRDGRPVAVHTAAFTQEVSR